MIQGYGTNIDPSKLAKIKDVKENFGVEEDGREDKVHGFKTDLHENTPDSDDPKVGAKKEHHKDIDSNIDNDIKDINKSKKRSVQSVSKSPVTLDMGKYTSLKVKNNANSNVKMIIAGVMFLLIFSSIMLTGIVYTSTVFSKAITESAITGAADAVRMINESAPKPLSELDLEHVPVSADLADNNTVDENIKNAYMGAIRNRYDEFAFITKASPEEIFAFDAMIKYALEKSQNKVLAVVFSPKDNANVQYAANGYNVWAYISRVKEKSGMDFDTGVALLEAAALVEYSAENNIPLSLAVGVAQTESAFNPGAYSNKAACGPMQVIYDIHKALLNSINIKSKEELFTADRGVQAGCYLLGRYLQAEKSVTGGLKRYYGALSENYINQVLSHRHAFELFEIGIEKDVAAAIEKENVNWDKMAEAKVPVYKDTTKVAKSNKSSKSGGSKSKKTAASNKTSTVATSSKSLTVRPDANARKDSQDYYNNTGTIVISKPDGTIQELRFGGD